MTFSTPKSRRKGFRQASALLDRSLQQVGQSRGFAVSKLLTHWAEIMGHEVAGNCTPVKVSYAQRGMGATLTILTTGAFAPMLNMQLPRLREKVNACYGYNAISQIKITQTAPVGFAEGQATFAFKPPPKPPVDTAPFQSQARRRTKDVADPALRDALNNLGTHILMKEKDR